MTNDNDLLTRRQVLRAGGTAAATTIVLGGLRPGVTAAARRAAREAPLAAGTFGSGVQAGMPFQHGVTLWTQLDAAERAGRLRLEIATDAGFANVVHAQDVPCSPVRDLTARARVLKPKLLKAGEQYHYRFATRTTSSPVGRFRTARPADSMEPLKLGFFSCQQYTNGFYTAHAGLAREDCDLIICLGDYMYEHGGAGRVAGREDLSSSNPETTYCETLADYRAKYRWYRRDANLRAVHESAAFVTTWDDHEVEDNHAGTHAGTTDPARRRIPYEERRRNAYLGFFEAMPIERIRSERDRIYRKVPLGGLADLFLLDLRQYRDDQACGDQAAVPCGEHTDPSRTLMGAAQKRWLKTGLVKSRAAWKLLGSSVEMLAWDGAPGLPLNPDGWDGYAAERTELLEHAHRAGVKDLAVITGDVHHFCTAQLTTSGRIGGTPVGVEFVGGAISSQFMREYAPALNQMYATNPHWRYVNFSRNGYATMTLTPKEMTVAYRAPVSIDVPESPVETIASFRTLRGTPDTERLT